MLISDCENAGSVKSNTVNNSRRPFFTLAKLYLPGKAMQTQAPTHYIFIHRMCEYRKDPLQKDSSWVIERNPSTFRPASKFLSCYIIDS